MTKTTALVIAVFMLGCGSKKDPKEAVAASFKAFVQATYTAKPSTNVRGEHGCQWTFEIKKVEGSHEHWAAFLEVEDVYSRGQQPGGVIPASEKFQVVYDRQDEGGWACNDKLSRFEDMPGAACVTLKMHCGVDRQEAR